MRVCERSVLSFLLDAAFKYFALIRCKLDESLINLAFLKALPSCNFNRHSCLEVAVLTFLEKELPVETLACSVAEEVLDCLLGLADLRVEIWHVVVNNVPVTVTKVGLSDSFVLFYSF